MEHLITSETLKPHLLQRENNSHKGDYGHLLLVCGCQRMPGAAVLATGAALHSGCGLVTLHSTERALQAVVDSFPSAMLSEDPGHCFSILPENIGKYSAIAVGPGLGQAPETLKAFARLLQEAAGKGIPLVLDADALNLLAAHPDLSVPAGSVMTPHLGELRRLTGDDSPAAALRLSRDTGCVVVRKGFHSQVITPDGEIHMNTTGNPGMAKGGSGDVFTGLIGGLLARGYPAARAACLGVWLHGFACDRLTATRTAEAYDSRDLISALPEAFRELY